MYILFGSKEEEVFFDLSLSPNAETVCCCPAIILTPEPLRLTNDADDVGTMGVCGNSFLIVTLLLIAPMLPPLVFDNAEKEVFRLRSWLDVLSSLLSTSE